jgi:hypothetical protein
MSSRTGRLRTPSIPTRTVLVGASLFALSTGLAQFLAEAPAWRIDSPVQYDSDFAVAVGLCWTLFQLAVHWQQRRERSRWLVASGAMVLLGAIQATDLLVSSGLIGDDWLLDLPLWVAAATLVHTVLRRGRERPWTMALWRVGLLLQTVFVVCDLCEGRSIAAWSVSAEDIASLAEWSELLAIESYVVALVLLGRAASPNAAALRGRALAVGAEARRVYEQAHLFRKAIYPPLRLAFYPGLRAALMVATSLGLVAAVGPTVRRDAGRSLTGQLIDLLVLGLRHGFDPLAYYFQELFRPGRRAEAAAYLTRNETKNGLLQVLNALQPSPDGGNEMKDKALFAARCQRAGLPVPTTLLSCDDQGVHGQVASGAFDRDLFLKPRHGRGARGVSVFERTGPMHYRAPDGGSIDLDALVAHAEALGRCTPLIVQPRLRNHPELADLADRSLVTVRVLTCLDAFGRPVATHGFLRILSKLEPGWRRHDEYGVPIALASGRLGPMRSDRLARCAVRYSHHPVTGRAVEGRVLGTWPALQALAVAAHRAFAHRILVGWDIASTPDGPVLLEGNINLDVMFPQRVHGQGFAQSPLGPLLQHHLATLARVHDVD